jgi:hypothetical protein
MSTFDRASYYYSGQGVVMIGERDTLGRPRGLIPVANVSALSIAIAETVLEHKESQSGTRGIDLRLSTETKCTLKMTMESFIAENLAVAMRASLTNQRAGAVTGEPTKAYLGKVMPLSKIKVSAVLVKRGATTLTQYVNDATAYDYKVNQDAGSIQLNDGHIIPVSATMTTTGVAPTSITVGLPTVVTVANTSVVGDYVLFSGFTGADAALINGKAYRITVATPTAVSLDLDTTGKTITLGTGLSMFDGTAITVDFAYEQHNKVDALTIASMERYLRFEGLNTADGNRPVVIEVFKFQTDPLKELLLINETITGFDLEGNVLSDSLQTSGSKFFKLSETR